MFVLQGQSKKTSTRQKQSTQSANKKGNRGPDRVVTQVYSFTYQCPRCLTLHKGMAQAQTEEFEIECLEPLDFVAVSDERFVLWLAQKLKGITPCCHFIHSTKGRKNSKAKEEGLHRVYDGRYDEETIAALEEKNRRRKSTSS
jgi:hypothetical protein